MMNRNYHFEDHDPAWAGLFDDVKKFVVSVLKEKVVSIEHVGSTSVSGLKSKPIIDVVVVIEPFSITAEEKSSFEQSGYYLTENKIAENSFILERGLESEKTENIHILPKGHPGINQMVMSRDYLRSHPERVEAYGNLKDELKEKHPHDYKLYRQGKEAFMEETEKLSREEYGQN